MGRCSISRKGYRFHDRAWPLSERGLVKWEPTSQAKRGASSVDRETPSSVGQCGHVAQRGNARNLFASSRQRKPVPGGISNPGR